MAFDINAIRITGTVEQFNTVNTRTGTPMVKLVVRCFKELFTVVAFNELAEATVLSIGDRVEVRGRVQSNTWTDQEGNKRYGVQVVATDIGPDIEEDQGAWQGGGKTFTRHNVPPPEEERSGVMEYQGGPF